MYKRQEEAVADILVYNGSGSRLITNDDTSPSELDGTQFWSVFVGESVSRWFTVRNDGSATLNFSYQSVGEEGTKEDFRVSNIPSQGIPAGDEARILITFTPQDAGEFSQTISLTSNGQESDYRFRVAGSAVGVIEPTTFESFSTLKDVNENGSLGVGINWGFYPRTTPADTVYRLQISKTAGGTNQNGYTQSRSAGGEVVVNHVILEDNVFGSSSSFRWDASQAGTLFHSSDGQQLSVSEGPQIGQTYYWRVYAFNTETGTRSDFSPEQSFTVLSGNEPKADLVDRGTAYQLSLIHI